ncbi:MAG: methyltransferase domain-containing protein [Symploca sp. SIO2C1]|nr:methyltransferase domain-containing protein [Symploca sp. SIO2C1]
MTNNIGIETIQDFGEQFTAYSEISGYFASIEILQDVLGPLMEVSDFRDRSVVDLGSGSGRWVKIFNQLGARQITVIEPSNAIEVCKKNNAALDNVIYYQTTGDKIPDGIYDIVYSFGVIHHIPEPDPVMSRIFEVLSPGGKAVIWIYGWENNELYLALINFLRIITVNISHNNLDKISALMVKLVRFYSRLTQYFPLPLKDYMQTVIDKLKDYDVKHIIYDQLNPHYAKYYRRQEAIDLLEKVGFENIKAYHKNNYSWTILGEKPKLKK